MNFGIKLLRIYLIVVLEDDPNCHCNFMREIVIYTSYYPFSKMSESFLIPELKVALEHEVHITIIPINKDSYQRKVLPGIIVDRSICDRSVKGIIAAIIGIFRFVPSLKSKDFQWGFRVKLLADLIKYLYAASLVYNDIKIRANNSHNNIYYSYWLSYAPIAFAFHKIHFPNSSHIYIARGHGSDIYGAKIGIYYPLRCLVFSQLDKIFIISKYGKQFISALFPENANKIHLARLGVYSNKAEHSKGDVIRFVSCSSVIPLKRVDLIFRSIYNFAIKHSEYAIEWIHIGGGPLLSSLRDAISHQKASNLECSLKGTIDNKEILQYYRDNNISAFVLLSTTEGIPVSIMEAISSGIPVIATNVGGVSEIVNNETGFLLDKNFVQKDFDDACLKIILNNEQLSKSAYNFFLSNYEAEKNFKDFYKQILN